MDARQVSNTIAEIMNEVGVPTGKHIVDKKHLKGGENFASLAKENVISTLTVIARKSAIDQAGGFSEEKSLRAVEDYDLWLRIAGLNPNGIKSVTTTLAYYRTHDHNISSANSILATERLISVLTNVWVNGCLPLGGSTVIEKQLDTLHENWSRLKHEENPDSPTVSVVMSVYNGKDFIDEAINSILNQTYTDFEFIIIDDGSSDNTIEKIKAYKDPRIRLICQNNHGLVYSFNQGIKLARGKYIARMDADDISLLDRFKKEVALLDNNPKLGLVGTFFQYIDESTSKRLKTVMFTPTKHIDIVRMMYIVNPFGHGSIMMRKQAAQEAGGYKAGYEPAEDYDLWHRIADNWQIAQIPEVLYLWRLNPNSISHTKMGVQHAAAARTVNELFENKVASKSLLSGIMDAKYYRNLGVPLSETLYHQYVDQQVVLAFHFLVRGRLFNGYKTFLTAFYYKPKAAIRLWKTLLWSPFRFILLKLGLKK
jgi:glycosyltransferase involved in cell wall biosynthesis